jgi:hypothetical protein
MYAKSTGVWGVIVERRASDSGDFCTKSDPLLVVLCTWYSLVNRLASGLLVLK